MNIEEECKGPDQNLAVNDQLLLQALNDIPKLAPIEMQELVFCDRDMKLLDLANHPEPEDDKTPRGCREE